MKTTKLLLLFVLACGPLRAAEPSLIVGKWQFSHGKSLPGSCRSAYVEYRSDGRLGSLRDRRLEPLPDDMMCTAERQYPWSLQA